MDTEDLVDNQVPADVDSSAEYSEKMLPQSQVDRIVKTAKLASAQKAREKLMAEMGGNSSESNSSSGYLPGNSMTVDEVRNIISQESQKQLQAAQEAQIVNEAHRIANEFKAKIDAGKTLYPDYEQVVSNLPFANISHLVSVANEFENTADLMYELGKNPTKLAMIHQVAQLNPALAKSELQKLSESMKLNEQAQKSRSPNAPLNQIPSSPVSVGGGSGMSVSDYRKVRR